MLSRSDWRAGMIRAAWMVVVVLLMAPLASTAQSDEDAGGAYGGFYGAGGIKGSEAPTGSGGAYIGLYDTGSFRKLVHPGLFLELGATGPTKKTSADGVFSFNFQSTYNTDRHPGDPKRRHIFVFVNGGYSRFFLTGNAADYGGGIIWRYAQKSSDSDLRFEYREYYIAGSGRQPTFRISHEWGSGLE
jgi:hypothetical protein